MGRAHDIFDRIKREGEQAIDGFIADRQSEDLFLDFKRSSDGGHGMRLAPDDRMNLAKAVSGFGNSEGGVIVWGVDCRSLPSRGDVAQSKHPIENPKQFQSWLEGAISGLTLPSHPNVQQFSVERPTGDGFVATLIDKSYLAPHQCVKTKHYYIRAGSSFEPTPHGVLAGMFGRSPQPEIVHQWSYDPATITDNWVEFHIGLLVKNISNAIARDLHVTFSVLTPGGQNEVRFTVPGQPDWGFRMVHGVSAQLTTIDSFKLAPEQSTQPLGLHFKFRPPFQKELYMRLTLGCSHSPVKVIERTVNGAEIERAYNILSNGLALDGTDAASHEFADAIIGSAADWM